MSIDFLNLAKYAALEGSRIVLHHYQHLETVERKDGDRSLVTIADQECERTIRDILLGMCPEHTLLGEEGDSPQEDREYCWIVDPIDGTTNFVHGFPHFCISIALYRRGVAQLGVVFQPLTGEWFTAQLGQGAYLNGKKLRVSQTATLRDALLVTGFPYDREHQPLDPWALAGAFFPHCRDLRRAGSAALDLCYVASGRLDGYFEISLGPWDAAAGVLIVTEAGGTVSDLWGKPLDLYNCRIMASNTLLHSAMLDLIAERFPGTQP